MNENDYWQDPDRVVEGIAGFQLSYVLFFDDRKLTKQFIKMMDGYASDVYPLGDNRVVVAFEEEEGYNQFAREFDLY